MWFSRETYDLSELSGHLREMADEIDQLPASVFFRTPPKLISEKVFDTTKLLYRLYMRWLPRPPVFEGIEDPAVYGLGEFPISHAREI